MEIKNLQKKKQFEQWIELDHLLIQIDARRDDVSVPVHFKNTSALALKISKNFQGELNYDDEKISVYLLFGDNYFCCNVPWDAIWGISNCNEESRVWKEDIPKEVLIELAKSRFSEIGQKLFGKKKPEAKVESKTESKPELKEVKSAKKKDSKEKRKSPDLKVIK